MISFISPILFYQGDEDIVFGTYYHPNGKQFTCIHQGGQRFYLDNWDTQVNISHVYECGVVD